MKSTIEIIMQGGVIQDILNIPKDIKIEVHDYDIDHFPNDVTYNAKLGIKYLYDGNGSPYYKSQWI